MQILISDIVVGQRIRLEAGDITELRRSMHHFGLLHPILVDNRNYLIAGFRRLETARSLGWKTIEAIQVEPRDEKERLLMELEENTTRIGLTTEEQERARFLIHQNSHKTIIRRFMGKFLYWFLKCWGKIKLYFYS